jgi:hypothetical protein
MLEREPGTGHDQAGETLRNRNRQPGADADPLAWANPGPLGRVEIEPRVVVMGAGRQRRLRAETNETELLVTGVGGEVRIERIPGPVDADVRRRSSGRVS